MAYTDLKECDRCDHVYRPASYLDVAWHREKIKYCLGEIYG